MKPGGGRVLSSPAENHCFAQEARLKGAATLRPTDKLVQNSAEQGSSPSSGQFFPYLIFPAACSSPLTHPILNISRAQRAANLSTLLQLPPVSSSFFPHPNSRNGRKIDNRSFFFLSLSLFSLPSFSCPFFKKKFVILDLVSSAERNFISPLRSFDTNFNKGQAAGKMHALEVHAIATRGQASIKPFVDRFPIFSFFFPLPSLAPVLLLFSPESSCSHN